MFAGPSILPSVRWFGVRCCEDIRRERGSERWVAAPWGRRLGGSSHSAAGEIRVPLFGGRRMEIGPAGLRVQLQSERRSQFSHDYRITPQTISPAGSKSSNKEGLEIMNHNIPVKPFRVEHFSVEVRADRPVGKGQGKRKQVTKVKTAYCVINVALLLIACASAT